MQEYELCIICGSMTGRAGKGDDSIYVDGVGPYCQPCEDLMIEGAQKELIAAAENLRDAYNCSSAYEHMKYQFCSKVDYYRTISRRKNEESKKLAEAGHASRVKAAIANATYYYKFIGGYTKEDAIKMVRRIFNIRLRATSTGFEELIDAS